MFLFLFIICLPHRVIWKIWVIWPTSIHSDAWVAVVMADKHICASTDDAHRYARHHLDQNWVGAVHYVAYNLNLKGDKITG